MRELMAFGLATVILLLVSLLSFAVVGAFGAVAQWVAAGAVVALCLGALTYALSALLKQGR